MHTIITFPFMSSSYGFERMHMKTKDDFMIAGRNYLNSHHRRSTDGSRNGSVKG